MGFWSSVGSAISGAFSSVGSAISSACSSVMSGLSNVLSNPTTLMTALAIAIPSVSVLTKAIAAIDVISKVLGLLKTDETTPDLGDRALQAQEAGINPEDYKNYKEYVSAIRDFKLDPEKSKSYGDTEKMIAGIGVQCWGFEENFGTASTSIIVKTLGAPDYFNGERLSSYLDKVGNISDVAKYFSGKLSSDQRNDVEAKIVAAEKEMNPEITANEIYKELDKHRDE